MSDIKGQVNLVNRIDKMIGEGTFPHFIIIQGGKGFGKTLFANYIAESLGASIYEAQDLKIDTMRDLISDSSTLNEPRVYLIENAENMKLPAQNCLLKFTEEPNANAYIIMTVNNLTLLPTIISRSCVFTIDPYSKDELLNFTSNEELAQICNSPGQIIQMLLFDHNEILGLCRKILDNIEKINVANVFNIVAKNIDDEDYSKFPTLLFLDCMVYTLEQQIRSGVDVEKATATLKIMLETISAMNVNGINKKNLLEISFLRVWKLLKEWS